MNDMTNTHPQNGMQAAVATVSNTQHLINTILKTCGGAYFRVSELFHKPDIRPLVKDRNQLSIACAIAYKDGKLGRNLDPVGKEKYAYGAPDPERAMVAQKARQKQPAKKTITKPAPRLTRSAITAHRPYTLTLQFGDAEEALAFMTRSGLVSPMVVQM